ncbi:PKD domain-containing protein, partial [Methanomethylovorans sp.]|uniref:PKD domain-containing protein n=1 Tax=Methanomethylovorans sp. TaxID=2758717 RepID=UPI00351C1E58
MFNYKSLLNVTSITDQGKKNSIPGTLRDTQNMCSPGRNKYPRKQNLVLGVCFFLACITVLSSFASAGTAPVADFSADATSGTFPLLVNFTDLSANSPTGWAWYFGDEDFSEPWTQVNSSAGWSTRLKHSSVVLPDGSIVLMGGYDGSRKNDVWKSTDNGTTWTQINSSAGWSARHSHSSVVLPDGSIVLTGGYDGSNRKNDVWKSTDNGATWTQVNSSAGWSGRYGHSSIVLPDGSIVLMGGHDGSFKNDLWRSTDNGATWMQVNSSAGWSGRYGHSSIVLPDGSIVLMGGDDESSGYLNDVWRSTDNGATWTQVNSSAEWSARSSHSSVVLPDGSIVLMGGDEGIYKNDVWRLTTAGSSGQDPSHTYTEAGTYQVALQAYNSEGYNSTILTDYITVTAPAPVANFSADATSGAIPLTVNFTDHSTNIPTSWEWNFGDGNTSTDQNPAHTYTSVGTYNVSLNATNVGGSNTSTQVSYITAAIAPVSGFSADVTSGAVPLAVSFTDQSTNTPTTWFWEFGDGTNSTAQNPSHTYTSVGTYTVTLNASNVGGSNTSTQVSYITAAIAPVSGFSADVTSGAVPLAVSFTDQSTNTPTTWFWDFGDGNTSTAQNPMHTYASVGTYNVSLNATNVGGS